MSGQPNEWDRFFIFYVISTLTSLVAQSLGLLIGAAAPQLEVSFIGDLFLSKQNIFKIIKRLI